MPSAAGLTSAEAARRLAATGPNRLVEHERRQRVREVLRLLADPMALMLVAAGVVNLIAGETTDAIILLAAIVPILGVDVLLEWRSHEALRKLAQVVSPRARVFRDGAEKTVPTESLVPGDVLLLREGDVLPADGTVVSEANFSVDESHLTGESEPQAKAPGAAFVAGSLVLAGHARGEVTRTGAQTEYAAIAKLVAATPEPSPLQRKTGAIVRKLAIGAVVLSAIVFALQLFRGHGLEQAFLGAIGVSIAAIPEEFPLVFTLFLALGAARLGARGVLVKRVASVETLGATTVICTDKTGTITRGTFELDAVVPLGGAATDELLQAAALACELEPVDPMERAIMARARGITAGWTIVQDWPFEPQGKHMTHVWQRGDERRVAMKGALEGVLEHAQPSPEAVAENERLARDGMRVLAVAAGAAHGVTREEQERGLRVVGLLGFRDPVRPEAKAAVSACHEAGIRVVMITGDHATTAAAIGRSVGIDDVRARVRPEEKHGIVRALRAQGEVVAMTGDGINDAPALREADIGVAMGLRGTDVARSAADLVLLKDDLGALVETIREGRRIFTNLRASFLYLISFHMPVFGLALLPPILGMPLLFWPVHLVWLQLIVHPVSALVFEGEAAAPDAMRTPPRDPRAPLLPPRLALRSALSGVLATVLALALYAHLLPRDEAVARGAAVALVIFATGFFVFADRAGAKPWHRAGLPRQPRFWAVWLLSVASLPAALYVHPLAQILRLAPPPPHDLLVAALAALATVAWRAGGISLETGSRRRTP